MEKKSTHKMAKMNGTSSVTSMASLDDNPTSRESVIPAYENAPARPAIPVPEAYDDIQFLDKLFKLFSFLLRKMTSKSEKSAFS